MASSSEAAAVQRYAATPAADGLATKINVVAIGAGASTVQSILPGASNLSAVWITFKPQSDIYVVFGTTVGMAAVPSAATDQIYFANQAEDVLVQPQYRFFKIIGGAVPTGNLYWHVSQP